MNTTTNQDERKRKEDDIEYLLVQIGKTEEQIYSQALMLIENDDLPVKNDDDILIPAVTLKQKKAPSLQS